VKTGLKNELVSWKEMKNLFKTVLARYFLKREKEANAQNLQ